MNAMTYTSPRVTLAGRWSCRISRDPRVVYRVEGDVLLVGAGVLARPNKPSEPMNRES